MSSKLIVSYHCEVCQKDTRHMKFPLEDVMRQVAEPGKEKAAATMRSILKTKSLTGAVASIANRAAYKCTRCRSYLIPHLGKEHYYAIDDEFQPWHVVRRNPQMLREVREKYNPRA